MTPVTPLSAAPLPGERWRRLALARVRKVGVGHPWRELSQRLLARRLLIEPRGSSARRAASESPAKKPLTARLAAESSPSADFPAPPTSPTMNPAANPMPAAPPTLDRGMQAMVEQLLQTRLPAIKIRHDHTSDLLTRRHQADALVRGDEIHFRRGAYDPSSPAGRGLIAHEATHLAWSRGLRPAFAPTAAVNMAELEEQLALDVEKRMRDRQSSMSGVAGRGPVLVNRAPRAAERAPSDARSAVRTALTSRELSTEEPAAAPREEMSEDQLRALKEDLYRTLLDRLRSEFERGG